MSQSQRLQRYFSPLLIGFMAIVASLVLAVVYVAFSKTTVTVTLKDIPPTIPFQYTTTELGVEAQTIAIDDTYTYTDYTADSSEDSIARGTVTLVNDYSGDQPLVRTTRLLSKDGVLFRIDETVTVPAGGSIDVPVYADQAGVSGNIDPTTFEIVALDDSLKDQIYAKSTSAMTGGVIKKVTLTEDLIAAAKAAAEAAATAAAEASIADANTDGWTVSLSEQTVNGVAGDVVNSIEVHTVGSATYVPITEADLYDQLVANDEPIAESAIITYTLSSDGNDWIVSGEATSADITPSLDFVDPADLTGKTEQQVKDFLADFDQVDSVTVQFVPFWIDRTPKLPQQINLQLAD
jgi:hypothetical protein